MSTKADLVKKIKEMRKGEAKKKRFFYHVELPTLANLAVHEGGADPRVVYLLHKKMRNLSGRSPSITLSELDPNAKMPSEEEAAKLMAGNKDKVAYVDAEDVPTSKAVVDCLGLAKTVIPSGQENVGQLSVVLSKNSKITASQAPYNGSMACTYGEADTEGKKKINMVPMFLKMGSGRNIGSLGGDIGRGLNELKETEGAGANDTSNTADWFNHHHFDENVNSGDVMMNPNELFLRAGGLIQEDSELFEVRSTARAVPVGDLQMHRNVAQWNNNMLLGAVEQDTPYNGTLHESI